jgi:hypothetical protein
MQIRIAALADYTNVTENKKLNIMGIFSQVHAVNVPAVLLQMQFVVQFAFEPSETGEKNIRILLQDADGQQVLSLEGRANIPRPEGPDPIVVNQVIVLQNVVFPHFGSYEFVIEVDGETMPVKVPVDVIPVAPSEQNRV